MLKGDFTNFVKEKLESGYDVSWSSHKDNKPVPTYRAIVEAFNGTWEFSQENPQVIYFDVFRTSSNGSLQMDSTEDSSDSKSVSPSGLQGVVHGSSLVLQRNENNKRMASPRTKGNATLIESATTQYEEARELFNGTVSQHKKISSLLVYFLPMRGSSTDVQSFEEVSNKKNRSVYSPSDVATGSGQGSQDESSPRSKLQKSSASGEGETIFGGTRPTGNATLIESATAQELLDGNDNPDLCIGKCILAATKVFIF